MKKSYFISADFINSRIDRWIDNIASKLRARSGKTKEFFDNPKNERTKLFLSQIL